MTELLQTFTNNLLPILIISGAGFLLGKFLEVEPRPIGRVSFYILSPILVFNLLMESKLSLDRIGLMMGYAAGQFPGSRSRLPGRAHLAPRPHWIDRGGTDQPIR